VHSRVHRNAYSSSFSRASMHRIRADARPGVYRSCGYAAQWPHLAQNRHKTGGEPIVFSSGYMNAIKIQLATQSAQNGLGGLLPS
jgi:hypothetical protein